MVSKTTLKEYEFESMEQYFDYIVESEFNGQRSQVKDLIKSMSTKQKKDAYKFLNQDILWFRENSVVHNLIHESI
tara:strand:+ start:8172 stop:8396 length:225 start_codon:yes stop_codon:yes gene_type:complete